MKSLKLFGCVLVACGLISSESVCADPVINVTPWLAPNGFGSPDFPAAADNAIYAIQNGLTSHGSGAAAFNAIADGGTIGISDNIVTGFNSWDGVADPNTPAFANQYGNRLHFGLQVLGNGTEVSAAQLGFTMLDTGTYSPEGLNLPSASFPTFGAVGTYNYSAQLVGWDYGVD